MSWTERTESLIAWASRNYGDNLSIIFGELDNLARLQ